jgi:hypothetical protein
MTELSSEDKVKLSQISGNMMTLLLLDDAWTESVQRRSAPVDDPASPDPFGDPASPVYLAIEMERLLLERMGEAADFIGSLPDRMGDDLSARFDALIWGDWLSSADRDDLRWLVTRVGGVTEMAQSASAALSAYEDEAYDLRMKMGRLPPARQSQSVPQPQSQSQSGGDLSKSYRCGLGSGLLVSGAAALPSAIGSGAAAAFTAGAGAAAAGVIVGATGGVAAIAIIVAGLLVMRRARC